MELEQLFPLYSFYKKAHYSFCEIDASTPIKA